MEYGNDEVSRAGNIANVYPKALSIICDITKENLRLSRINKLLEFVKFTWLQSYLSIILSHNSNQVNLTRSI